MFIDLGSDANLLKSLTDNPLINSESLQKAMDKAGMVQVQTTVNGQNGQYTRMQWKRSSDIKQGDTIVGGGR